MQTSVSQILAKTGETVKNRIGGLLGIWGIYFAAQIVLFIVLGVVIGGSLMAAMGGVGAGGLGGEGAAAGLGAGAILLFILAYLVILLIAAAQSSSMIAFASPLQKLSLGDALNAGIRSALPMLGVMVLLLIAYFICALVVGLVGGILASVLGSAAGVLVLLLLPAVLYVACRLCTINGVVAVDGVTNPITAIQRGWAQTRSNALAIFGSIAIFALAALIVGGGLFYSYFTSMMSAAALGQPPSFAGMGLTMVGFLIFSVVMAVIGQALFAVIHAEVSDASPAATSEVFG
jgi:hypothetical protein